MFILILIIVMIVIIALLGDVCTRYHIKIVNLKKENKALSIIERKLTADFEEQTKQMNLYRQRSIELEDSIKEGYGVSLRNEITKLDCIFDEKELQAIVSGLHYLIKEYYHSTDGVKYYLTLIQKIESKLIELDKSRTKVFTSKEGGKHV